eukprot:2828790-Pleurochrysis_carterae.AAC.3
MELLIESVAVKLGWLSIGDAPARSGRSTSQVRPTWHLVQRPQAGGVRTRREVRSIRFRQRVVSSSLQSANLSLPKLRRLNCAPS